MSERNKACQTLATRPSHPPCGIAMDLEDTESVVSNNSLTGVLECDLAHIPPEAHGTQCAVAGEDFPRASRRLRLTWNEDADPHVRVAQALLRTWFTEWVQSRQGPCCHGQFGNKGVHK